VTKVTAEIVDSNSQKNCVTTFRASDGILMFHIPHCYDPYWDGRED
jgi:hypothetical protein